MKNQQKNQDSALQKDLPKGQITRRAAVRILMAVTLKKRPFDVALDDITHGAGVSGRDRAFVLILVMTALRRRGALLKLLDELLDRGLPFEATWTRAALTIALAELLLLETPDHAGVHEYVELIKTLKVKEHGFSGLVNAVLRRATREKTQWQVWLTENSLENIPVWLRTRWQQSFDQGTIQALATSLNTVPPLDISLKDISNTEGWASTLSAVITPTGTLRTALTDVRALEGYSLGAWWVQDMAASLPVKLLGNVQAKHVLDLCAAPGGKTMQLAAGGAVVSAVDRSKNRMKRLSENLSRTKLNANIFIADASCFQPEIPVDYILLDAPCSATGTFRRNPDIMWTKSDKDIEKLTALQSRLLGHAFDLLPVGGTLVYCVCSLEKSEGLDQILHFLSQKSNAKRVPISADEIGGLAALITPDGDLFTHPNIESIKGGMDGFFACRLTKI